MKILQLLPTMSFGDAVSNDTAALRALMEEMGYPSEIYAENIDPRLMKHKIYHVKDIPPLKNEDLLIYHLSTGTELNNTVQNFRCRKVMFYHNITPPAYFAPYNRDLEELCLSGLQGMIHLRNSFETVVADSEFNRQNLLDAGYTSHIHVAPILIPFKDYEQKPDPEIVKRYSDGHHNILFVGRIAPNKKQEDVIRAFHCYQLNYDPQARLFLIGSSGGMDSYLEKLKRYTCELGIEEKVIFSGHISFQQILAYYHVADAFLCMSEHEGFCVPLVEAMYFKVPIIARRMCAVPETLGSAGLILEDNRPEPAAEALHQVLTQPVLRKQLQAACSERLKDFSYEKISAHIKKILLPLIEKKGKV